MIHSLEVNSSEKEKENELVSIQTEVIKFLEKKFSYQHAVKVSGSLVIDVDPEAEENVKYEIHFNHIAYKPIVKDKTSQVQVETGKNAVLFSDHETYSSKDSLPVTTDETSVTSLNESAEEENEYDCLFCGLIFENAPDRNRHETKHHIKPPYACVLCKKTYKRLESLRAHKMLHIKNDLEIKISEAVEAADSITVEISDDKDESKDSSKSYICKDCKKEFDDLNLYYKHLKIAHKIDFVTEESSSSDSAIAQPVYIPTGNHDEYMIAYQYNDGSLVTASGDNLDVLALSNSDNHQKLYEQPSGTVIGIEEELSPLDKPYLPKKFSCNLCSKKFISRSQLIDHHHMHTGEKPYSCSYCGKKFRLKSSKTIHERIHTGEKPYRCTYCTKRFTQFNHLRNHENLHTGVTFDCDECGKGFANRNNLYVHKTGVHRGIKRQHSRSNKSMQSNNDNFAKESTSS